MTPRSTPSPTGLMCWCGLAPDHPMTDDIPQYRHAGPGNPCEHPNEARRTTVKHIEVVTSTCSVCEQEVRDDLA